MPQGMAIQLLPGPGMPRFIGARVTSNRAHLVEASLWLAYICPIENGTPTFGQHIISIIFRQHDEGITLESILARVCVSPGISHERTGWDLHMGIIVCLMDETVVVIGPVFTFRLILWFRDTSKFAQPVSGKAACQFSLTGGIA